HSSLPLVLAQAPRNTQSLFPPTLHRYPVSPAVDPDPTRSTRSRTTSGRSASCRTCRHLGHLFSIGVGPSSSHTVGPMRAGKIFVTDLQQLGILDKVRTLKIGLFGSLAATGKGTSSISSRYASILAHSRLNLAGTHSIRYSHERDMLWTMDPLPAHPNGMRFSVFDDQGTLLATNEYYSVGGGFVVNERTQVDENLYYRGIHKQSVDHARRDQTHGLPRDKLLLAGDMLPEPPASSKATDEGEKKEGEEKMGSKAPPFLFRNAQGLLNMTQQNNLTIAQLVWENERSYLSDAEISHNLLKIWAAMDASIHAGVSSRRDASGPIARAATSTGTVPSVVQSSGPLSLSHGFTSPPPSPSNSSSSAPLVVGNFEHPLIPTPWKKAVFPGIDFLSCYAIAVNETNAGGGRVVTSPTNGAAGVIPAVLKVRSCLLIYIWPSDLTSRNDSTSSNSSRTTLTAISRPSCSPPPWTDGAAIGMLYKRGATISAAEGGCMAEVGVASSMAAGGFTACMGGSPSQILQAAEIGIEHSLGLTCDPIDGLVQVPCIERNSLGAVKAVTGSFFSSLFLSLSLCVCVARAGLAERIRGCTAAQLALAGEGIHSVSLDEAIEAMRITARDMHHHYKETSLSGLAVRCRAGFLSSLSLCLWRPVRRRAELTSLGFFTYGSLREELQTTVRIPLSSPAC
ncbi:SPOSA6832_00521, partial [Sporobolomyces salmonicolor]